MRVGGIGQMIGAIIGCAPLSKMGLGIIKTVFSVNGFIQQRH